MDSEDDICILQQPDDEDVSIDAAFQPVLNFSLLSRSTSCDVDRGSHHALKKAYSELKRRLNETNAQNQQLTRRIRELESSRNFEVDSSLTVGDSFDMMDDARFMGQGVAAGLSQSSEAQVGAEEGFANNLYRQLMRAKAQLQAVEAKYQEKVQETDQKLSSIGQQVVLLNQEKISLQQSCEGERKEKEAVLKTLQDLREKYTNLQVERDKAIKEGAMLHASLEKANQEVEMLKEKQGESVPSEPPTEMVNELAHMRRVIDKLKTMVLMQKDCLVTQSLSVSMRSSLNRSPREPPSMESDLSAHSSNRSGGSPSSHSWEMVNGAHPQPTDVRQQLLQQRSAKIIPVETGPRPEVKTNQSSAGRIVMNGGGNSGKRVPANGQNGPGPNQQNIQAHIGQNGADLALRKEAVSRRHSEDDVQHPKSKTEVIRAHTLPQAPRLAAWMGSHYQQHQPVGSTPLQQGQLGLNQLLQNPSGSGLPEVGQGGTRQSRPSQFGVQHPQATSSPQRQTSPVNEPTGTYDNLPYTATTTATANSNNNNNNGTTGPSMHILNQNSMTGARVLQSNPSSFGNVGRSVVPSNQQTGIYVGVNRDGVVVRGSPQEHADVTRPHNPTDLELNQVPQIHFVNEPTGNQSRNEDRKCPVCGQDFSHITMDEFQSHVFECFDDADESSNAPETLQPRQENTSATRPLSADRVCPMCEKSFPPTVTQSFFEGHVQSHFEEVADHFEVLDMQRTS